jgi:sigma-B regulation protein RsbU (phosphoserine phosphatase)
MVKIAFAGQLEHAADPARVLAGMNEILHGRVQRQFVTALYVFIDPRERSIVYASAGHPSALLRHSGSNAVEQLRHGGTALGPFKKSVFVNHRATIEPGDRLVLYTDGLIEASNAAQEFYGDTAFERFIRARGPVPVEQFTQELLEDVGRWAKIQGDDLTIVAVDSVV